jgi:hypothetical protein
MSFKWVYVVSLNLALILASSPITSIQVAASEPQAPSANLCSTQNAIVGTEGDDIIVGTEGDDIICGGAGNDVIDGLGGDDIIIGGSGDDQIVAGAGNDKVAGGPGNDIINGNSGEDYLWGEAGEDIVAGDDGDDYISGGPGADHLYGGGGLDQLLGGLGDDGLDGGLGRDLLNGQRGDDVCVRDSADIRTSCDFDERGPELVNFALDPGSRTVDAKDSNPLKRVVRFRFTVVDPGTGVNSLYVGFRSVLNKGNSDFSNSLHISHDYGSCSNLEKAVSNLEPTPGSGGQIAGYCLLAGNSNRGVYEGAAVLPENAVPGTWLLTTFFGTDNVGNRHSVGDYELAQKRLRVKFRQIGETDSTPPQLIDVSLAGQTVLSDESQSTAILVLFEDKQSDLKSIHVNFQSTNLYTSFGQTFRFGASNPVPSCNEDTKGKTPCLERGTLRSGAIVLPITYSPITQNPRDFGPFDFYLASVSLEDSSGNNNNAQLSKAKQSELFFKKDFWSGDFADDGDSSEPVVESFVLSPARINTSRVNQTVEVRLKVSDKGVGLNFDSPRIEVRLALSNPSVAGTGSTNSQKISCPLFSKSGNGNMGEYVLRCTVPARFPRGEFIVDQILISDASIRVNTLSYDSVSTPEARIKFPIKLRNG